jgi:hypothetical protein
MKPKARLAILVAFLWLFSQFPVRADEAQRREWKGKIETVDGVKVVNNPGVPIYAEIKLDLTEDLKIGKEGDPNTQFFGVRDVAVDGEGNIYVADMKNYRVQKFDKEGKYVLTIGRQGQGPGEFELPTQVRINEMTGDIYVKDRSMALKVFSRDGAHLNRDLHLPNVIRDYFLDEDGNLTAVIWKSSDVALTNVHALCRINTRGEILETYGEFPFNVYMKRTGEGTLLATTGFEVSLQLAKLDPKTFVYGYSKANELVIIDKTGHLLGRIKKEEPAPKFSSKEKAEFKKIPLPEMKPYFYSILADSEGRIYVQRNMAATGRGPADRESLQVDAFSREGYFLFRTVLPPNTKVIRDGFLYAYSVEEEQGMEYAKRYRIRNWQSLAKSQ